jgi:outer membrane protein OmpA-like peptidoglycan-associated protein
MIERAIGKLQMHRPAFTLIIAILSSLPSVSALAQDASEINRIIRGLAPIAGQTVADGANAPLVAPAPGLGTSSAPRPVLLEVVLREQVIVVDTSYAMDFEVYFPFDSSDLTARARQELMALGQALASPDLRPYRYLIAGHTDGVGQPTYNQTLSERRAAAVRAFLTQTFPIEPHRLVSVGFGQERLKRPAEPRAAVNRRVEVLLIAGP